MEQKIGIKLLKVSTLLRYPREMESSVEKDG
jgi:hypothetical protein